MSQEGYQNTEPSPLLTNFGTSQLLYISIFGKRTVYSTLLHTQSTIMTVMCTFCVSVQERLLADGDRSQVICEHMPVVESLDDDVCGDSDAETSEQQVGTKRKRANSFTSHDEFDNVVSKNNTRRYFKMERTFARHDF